MMQYRNGSGHLALSSSITSNAFDAYHARCHSHKAGQGSAMAENDPEAHKAIVFRPGLEFRVKARTDFMTGSRDFGIRQYRRESRQRCKIAAWLSTRRERMRCQRKQPMKHIRLCNFHHVGRLASSGWRDRTKIQFAALFGSRG